MRRGSGVRGSGGIRGQNCCGGCISSMCCCVRIAGREGVCWPRSTTRGGSASSGRAAGECVARNGANRSRRACGASCGPTATADHRAAFVALADHLVDVDRLARGHFSSRSPVDQLGRTEGGPACPNLDSLGSQRTKRVGGRAFHQCPASAATFFWRSFSRWTGFFCARAGPPRNPIPESRIRAWTSRRRIIAPVCIIGPVGRDGDSWPDAPPATITLRSVARSIGTRCPFHPRTRSPYPLSMQSRSSSSPRDRRNP